MFNEQQSELSPKLATQTELVVPAEATSVLGEGQMTELSESDLDDVSGGFSLGELGSFFQESSSFFSETNIFFEQSSFAGRDGAGGQTTFALQAIESGNTQRAGGFAAGAKYPLRRIAQHHNEQGD